MRGGGKPSPRGGEPPPGSEHPPAQPDPAGQEADGGPAGREADGGPAGRDGQACPGCGGLHEHPLEELSLRAGALQRLGELAGRKRWGSLLVVADANTAEVLGDETAALLAGGGHAVSRLTFPLREGLRADEGSLAQARAAVASSGADAAVSVGSGTVTDITRAASFLEDRPFCAVATAASMDGYASGVAAMQFGGVKVTLETRPPVGVFAEPTVLAAAPREMAAWGLGDLLGKASASFDWRLGHGVTGEAYCPEIEARVLRPVRRCAANVEAILDGDETGLSVLLSGLVESGVAMAMFGSSRPASGCEHHCSHLFDLLAFRGLRRHGPHGLQVGYATGFATSLQRACIEGLGEPLLLAPGTSAPGESRWLGVESAALEDVRSAKARAFAGYAASWPPDPAALAALGELLAGAVGLFAPVTAALERAGIPAGTGFLGVDDELLRATLRYANHLRNRFTVLDLLESQRRLEQAIDSLLGESSTHTAQS
ncbi:MAG TPA: iron-containing alcohol dehydrogenase [Acidimicrobiales bacterium]|nr:iron-containing alcohol dehydrogenase [Acidimicrobiales bacterium]